MTRFNFIFDPDLKRRVKEYGQRQKPTETITHTIHKALYRLLQEEEESAANQ